MEQIIPIVIGVVALLVGVILGKIIFAKNTKQILETAEQQAQKTISDAQTSGRNAKKRKASGS